MLRHLLLCATLFVLALPLAAQEDKGKPQEVTKLNGAKILGLVEITDDYTIRISSDSGLQKIPIALLSQKDFEKYSGTKDRNQDGRLWSERKHALEDSQSKGQEKPADIEIRLGEIAAFQPLIDAYEKTLAEKKAPPPRKSRQQPPKPPAPSSRCRASSPVPEPRWAVCREPKPSAPRSPLRYPPEPEPSSPSRRQRPRRAGRICGTRSATRP